MNIQQEIQKALQSYNAGDLQQAKAICKNILKKQSDNWEVLHFLGVIYSQLGNHDLAMQTMRKSLDSHPHNPDAYLLIALSCQRMGRDDEAIAYYKKAIEQDPNYAEAYNNLGNFYKEQKRFEDAVAYYQKAIELKPDLAVAYYNLGVICQEKKDVEEAISFYRKALQFDPSNFQTLSMLGMVLHSKGEKNEAMAYYRKAIELNPDVAETQFNLGLILQEIGQADESIQHYQKAIELDPNFSGTYSNLGVLFQAKNRFDEALFYFQKVLTFDADCAQALNNIGNLYTEMGRIDEAEDHYRRLLEVDPSLFFTHSNLLLAMNYNPRHNMEALFSEHLRYGDQHAGHFSPHVGSEFENDKQIHRRLRIGYVSPDFRQHPVAYFIEPVISAHNRELFEIWCYANVSGQDAVFERIRALADRWLDISGMSTEQVSKRIRDDRIDILVDLAGHSGHNCLPVFARKPAPIQVTWIGYPATTGLQSIDYKIIDRYTDPPGMTEQFYTEKLIRMPDSFLCYLPERDAPDVNGLPALRNGYITFGCFNNFAKVSHESLKAWALILKMVPGSRLIMKSKGLSSAWVRKYVLNFFEQEGIEVGLIELHSWTPTVREHHAFYHRVDIALDTFPYQGTTTTCEALYMGVPVVTLEGKTYASRVGISLLTNAGLVEFIARSPEEYVEIAVRLASDLSRLALLRRSLRHMVAHSPLTDVERFMRHLETAYRQMWINWCNLQPPEHIEIPAVAPMEERTTKDAQPKSLEPVTGVERLSALPLPIEAIKVYRTNDMYAARHAFVVCAMFTPGSYYYRCADRLADSCERFRLPYRIYKVPHVHTSISLQGTLDPAFTKANVIAFVMQQFPGKNVLYLDVDVLFVDYPERLISISNEGYDLALYNWLGDWRNEAYAPVIDTYGGKRVFTRCYVYSHHIGFYCPDQLICSGGAQFYRNDPLVMKLLNAWQNVIAKSPLSADDECLDMAYNNRDHELSGLKAVWLDKSYLRMPWWPHVKPVILHPEMPVAGNRSPLPAIDGRQRFYPERCRQKRSDLLFPPDYYIDADKKLLVKIENASVADVRSVQQEFWTCYEEEM